MLYVLFMLLCAPILANGGCPKIRHDGKEWLTTVQARHLEVKWPDIVPELLVAHRGRLGVICADIGLTTWADVLRPYLCTFEFDGIIP